LILMDTVLLPFALFAALFLRYEQFWPNIQNIHWLFLAAPITALPIFIRLGLYRAILRYMGTKAVFSIIRGVTIATAVLFVISAITNINITWSVFGIYWAIAVVYIGGSRLILQDLFQTRQKSRLVRDRVVIYGAGSAGIQLATGLFSSQEFVVVAFVDDKSELQGNFIHGIRVYAPAALLTLISNENVSQILLAIPSAPRNVRRKILQDLEPLPVHIKTIPGTVDLIEQRAEVSDIREVDIEDLLGRDPVPPHKNLLDPCIKNKSVMVTGAGGSIGSELCRQIIKLKPTRLVLFEKSEYNLYSIEQELRQIQKQTKHSTPVEIIPILGSITHKKRVTSVLQGFQINTVYHAAAYKHVPLVEQNPIEGIRNNIFGTLAIAEAASACNVETFVLVSTDKAVRPTNVMGATKRIAELILQGLARQQNSSTTFCIVRFGNVLASSGSVVPLFRKQIARGGPVTVTHPDINRYFMTIPEASQLVLQTGALAKGGDVFVLDMGEPIKILDLAKKMINLSGLSIKDDNNPNGDIEISYSGLRPGEKLYEELLIDDNAQQTKHKLIMRAEEMELPWPILKEILNKLDASCHEADFPTIRKLLKNTVAGYCPQCDIEDLLWRVLGENNGRETIIDHNNNKEKQLIAG
ncbi:MAG TPA: polysaccharide biosynthesis protein, partial [Gammaproteobacteria bacterium]|nr:polysaccharide biosynthesis protein [Gammaproteobacteria bacterium]